MERILNYMHAHETGAISQYVGQLRIGSACCPLAQTDQPLALTADNTGFSDVAHSSRQFHAARGLAPGHYRRQFRERHDSLNSAKARHGNGREDPGSVTV
ncbi:hypothetical protein BJF92_21495 [Rhizobium rhizosphaerae]|uniref:HTH araC/xylS-type domain-containing protein n=1 Tax=Xaviernesmea rhizosphaerae TaxID=1672749 RepID=A0A1Q9ANT6_9HYPH|nr:helix-turn-helix domain-containing protein [Xaviernesmea rhizosphaerae]OLP57075.1 hypothetical protein BJF92_21495 [Xaviernesmea rhizosphaerae]